MISAIEIATLRARLALSQDHRDNTEALNKSPNLSYLSGKWCQMQICFGRFFAFSMWTQIQEN
jgi:hypothetical protein